MFGKRNPATIDALRTAGGVRVVILLLALILALAPGLGLAQEEVEEDGGLAWVAGLVPWRTMFGWVQIKGVAETLTLAILTVFAAVWAWLCAVWWQNARALKGLLGKIKAISRDPYGFAERFRDLSAEMQAKQFAGVRHAWEEFRESVFTGKDEGGILAYNTVPPENFFTPDKLGMNFAAFRAMANYFVGVGLLLTFFGLAAALFFASESITAGGGDVAKTQEALQKLLNAATLKFMTSIAGLLSSIVLSVFVLLASRHVSGLCANICEELNARVRFAVQEHFAVLQLRELREQTAALKTFSTDLGVSIAKNIQSPISAGVRDALQESGISDLTDRVSKTSGNMEEIKGKLDALAGDIAKSIEGPVNAGISAGVKGLGDEIGKLAADALKSGKEGAQEITKNISGKIEGVTQAVNTASGALVNVAGDLQKIASSVEGQTSVAGDVRAQMSALQEAVNGLGNVLGGQRDKFDDLADKMQEAVRVLGAATDQHTRTVKEASDSVVTAVSGIKAEMAELQKAVNGLGEVLGAQRENFQTLANKTQEAAKALGAAADQHKQAVKPIDKAALRIKEAVDEIRKLHGKIEDSNDKLRKFWEAHDGRFVGVDERLEAVVKQILKGGDDYRESVGKFVDELTKKLADALAQIGSAVHALSEVADGLSGGKRSKP